MDFFPSFLIGCGGVSVCVSVCVSVGGGGVEGRLEEQIFIKALPGGLSNFPLPGGCDKKFWRDKALTNL